jgi:cation/acetate symporter
MNDKGAIAGMCAGLGVTMLYVFQHKGIMFIPGTSFLGDMQADWFFGISPNAFGAVGAIVNFAVAFIVLKMTQPAPQEIRDLVDNFRSPHGEVAAAQDH